HEICINFIKNPPDLKKYKITTLTIRQIKWIIYRLEQRKKYKKYFQGEEDRIFLTKKYRYISINKYKLDPQLNFCLQQLPIKNRTYIKLNFGIGCEPKTMREIAARYNITRQ